MQFFIDHAMELVMALATAGALGLCKWFHSKAKQYQELSENQENKQWEEIIDHKLEPIIDEIEQLREYIRKQEVKEKASMDLIIASYRYRLI